jgi:hypothetical protein
LIPTPLYCICMLCKDYSVYSTETFCCEKGHEQGLPAIFVREGDGTEFLFRCPSACVGGAVYSMGRCTGCDEKFVKTYFPDKTGSPKPENFVLLYSAEFVNERRQSVAKSEPSRDDSMDPMCPVCGDLNQERFIFEPDKLRTFGFAPTKIASEGFSDNDIAEFGICSAPLCIQKHGRHPYGVALIPRRQWVLQKDDEYDTRGTGDFLLQPCDVEGCLGFYRDEKGLPVCEECGHTVRTVFEKRDSSDRKGDAYYILKHQYAGALEGRRAIVDPPYYYTSAENPFKRESNLNTQSVPQEADKAVSAKQPDEWFHCLETYLRTLVKAEGYLHEHLTAAAYLDKTFRRGHVEPLWMFASERNGVGNNIHRAFEVASTYSSVFEPTIQSNLHVLRPSKDSIQVVYGIIKRSFGNLWPLAGNPSQGESAADVDAGLIENAIKGWERLQQWKYYQKFWDVKMLRPPYDVNGLMPAAPGLVEAICVLWSLRQKNHSVYEEVRSKVFPDMSAYWQRMLTDEGIALVSRLDVMVFKQMDQMERT